MNCATPCAPARLTAAGSNRLSCQISRAKKSVGRSFALRPPQARCRCCRSILAVMASGCCLRPHQSRQVPLHSPALSSRQHWRVKPTERVQIRQGCACSYLLAFLFRKGSLALAKGKAPDLAKCFG